MVSDGSRGPARIALLIALLCNTVRDRILQAPLGRTGVDHARLPPNPTKEMQRLLRHFQATQSCFLHSRFGRLPEYQYFIVHPSAVCQCGNSVWNPTVSGRAYVECKLWYHHWNVQEICWFTVQTEDKWRQQRVEFARGHWSRSTSSWSL